MFRPNIPVISREIQGWSTCTAYMATCHRYQIEKYLRTERDVLFAVKNEEDILIFLADKNNEAVIMSNENYHHKFKAVHGELINMKLNIDPTGKIEKRNQVYKQSTNSLQYLLCILFRNSHQHVSAVIPAIFWMMI